MITLELEKCSGCTRCEVHCSFFHTARIGRSTSRIRVVKIEELGIDYPVVCQQCIGRYCTECPEGAIDTGQFGQIVVDSSLCTGCGTCETLCPIGAIELYEDLPGVCDLCGGNPHCVQACTLDAIHFEPEVSEAVDLEEYASDSRKLQPHEKRLRYARKNANSLRDRWIAERRRGQC
jgi:Fe-S-cluster-containing hydrogenase component 2